MNSCCTRGTVESEELKAGGGDAVGPHYGCCVSVRLYYTMLPLGTGVCSFKAQLHGKEEEA